MARKIAFYAEDNYSLIHFEKMLVCFTQEYGQKVCYLTSSVDAPILSSRNPKIHVFYIGEGMVRTSLFLELSADLFVLTMPDLETYHLKRSKMYPVHYLYVFHALVSTFSNYRKSAFDHYDLLFLTSAFQKEEVRSTESIYNLPKKVLVEVGYPHLDSLRRNFESWKKSKAAASEGVHSA